MPPTRNVIYLIQNAIKFMRWYKFIDTKFHIPSY